MNFEFVKKNKKEITISLATGLALILAEPLLKWLGGYLLSAAISIQDGFSDFYFRSIANNNGSWSSEESHFLLVVFFSCNSNLVLRDS